MGRPTLGAGEVRRMTVAVNLRTAYNSRKDYRDKDGNSNWAEWSSKHPDLREMLNSAALIAEELEADSGR